MIYALPSLPGKGWRRPDSAGLGPRMAVGWRPQCSQIEPRLDFQVELVRLALTVSWVFLLYIVSACTVSAIYNLFQISIDGKVWSCNNRMLPAALRGSQQITRRRSCLQESYKSFTRALTILKTYVYYIPSLLTELSRARVESLQRLLLIKIELNVAVPLLVSKPTCFATVCPRYALCKQESN